MTDALLIVSYGAPEGLSDVRPYLENLLKGPEARPRIEAAARKYERLHDLCGECSPLAQECRNLIAGLVDELDKFGPKLPIYWGNVLWHPMLEDTVAEMAEDGIRSARAYVTSYFDSPYGNERYTAAIARACEKVGPAAPVIERMPLFWNEELFHGAQADNLLEALARARIELTLSDLEPKTKVIFTAHSIPLSEAESSPYREQLLEAGQKIAKAAHLGVDDFPWELAYQSRSGSKDVPWLEPSPEDCLKKATEEGFAAVVLVPFGFACENMETAYDLDVELASLADSLGLIYSRANCVGSDAKILRLIRQHILPND